MSKSVEDQVPAVGDYAVEQLALTGSAAAQHQHALKYYHGIGIDPDFSEAAKWFGFAAAQGHPKAQALLGLLYQDGMGVEQNLETARELYTLAAAQNEPMAIHNLGYLCETEGDLNDAAIWYQRGADLGYRPSFTSLAFAYSNGHGVAQDFELSIKLYTSSADQGDGLAALNLGLAYLYGHKVKADQSTGFHYLALAAELEEVRSYYHLAFAYSNALGTVKDQLSAQMWMSLASLCGIEEAMSSVHSSHQTQVSELGSLIGLACAGQLDAMSEVAARLYEGNGFSKNATAAKAWLRQAANRGDAWSQTTLGIKLRQSQRLSDQVEAASWFKKAIAQGDARAMLNQGLSEILGLGVPVDNISGATHILASSLRGYEDAKTGFEESTKPLLTSDELHRVYEQTLWPIFVIVLGSNLSGHLSEIFEVTENDLKGGDKYERLMDYENQNVAALFNISFLDKAYESKITVDKYQVTPSFMDGEYCTVISINTKDIKLSDGSPAFWKPSDDQMKAFLAVVQMIEMRTSLRWGWITA